MQDSNVTPLAAKVIQKIKDEQIAPHNKIYLSAKQWFLYLICLISMTAAAISAGALFYLVSEPETGSLLRVLNPSTLTFLLIAFGISFFSVLSTVWISLRNYRATRFGYRPSLMVVTTAGIALILALVTIAHQTGASKQVADAIAPRLPHWEAWQAQKAAFWMDPQNGRLTGKIAEVLDSQRLLLEDSNGKIWQVNFSMAQVRSKIKILPGERIKILGKAQTDTFEATEIRPWNGHGRRARHRSKETSP